MIPKSPVMIMRDTASGREMYSYADQSGSVLGTQFWIIEDKPDNGTVNEWLMEPRGCVEWVLDHNGEGYETWKRKFKIRFSGEFWVRATDENGFKLDGPKVSVSA